MKLLFLLTAVSVASILYSAEIPKVSDWGFDPVDSTGFLQKAIDSGVPRLLVDNTGKDWITGPLKLRSDLELIFADGVTVRALRGDYKHIHSALLTANDGKNIIIRGDGRARLVMNKKDYQNADEYAWSEWRHLINLRGCEKVTIRNLTLESSGGDGIYISTSGKLAGCRDIVIDSVTAEDHHRQGISVISAENLLVRNCKFNRTSGTSPRAGIDFEPNKEDEWLINCVVENCEFNDNAGAGVLMHLAPLTANSKPVSITVRNSTMDNNLNNIIINAGGSSPVGGFVNIEDCRLTNPRNNSAALNDFQTGGLKLTLKNIHIEHGNSSAPVFNIGSRTAGDTDNIFFEDVVIRPGKGNPFEYLSLSGGGIRNMSGSIRLENAQGAQTAYDLKRFVAANKPDPELKKFQVRQVNLKELVPVNGTGNDQTSNIRYRGKFRLLQYCPAGASLDMKFAVQQVSKAPINVRVSVKDAHGTPIDDFRITDKAYTYHLKSNSSQVMVLEFQTGSHTLTLESAYPGQAVMADNAVGMFMGAGYRNYLLVPAGAENISIEVTPDVNEPVSVELIDPNGGIVQSFKRSSKACHINYRRTDTSKDEIWCLNIPHSREDFKIRVGAPVLPLLSSAPENLLTVKK